MHFCLTNEIMGCSRNSLCHNASKKKKEEEYATDAGKIVIARNEFPPLTAPSLHLIHKNALDGKQSSEADESDKA